MKEEVPPLVVEAHTRNVEATTASRGDKVEGGVGLNVSGIATDDKGIMLISFIHLFNNIS